MIQRVQSLLLLLTTLLSVLFPVGTIIKFSQGMNEIFLRLDGIFKTSQGTAPESLMHILPFTVLMLIIPVLSFIIIFLYKNRKLQMRLTGLLIVLIVAEIIFTGYYVLYITGNYNAEIHFSTKLVIPVVILISSILAYSYIKKDDELVRSYDRLR